VGRFPPACSKVSPNVERVIALKKRKRHGHWIDLWKIAVKIKWDVVIDLRNSAVSRLIRAGERFFYGPHIRTDLHKVEQAARVMQMTTVPSPALHFTAAQKKFAEELVPPGVPVIAVGPSANWIGKTWATDNFIEIVRWLRADGGFMPGARVAVFAAPGEEAQALPVLESIPPDMRIDGIARGNPGEVAAALSRCSFYIGNDSGLMHAAAAAGVPTFGVFGPSWPHIYRPWGQHTAFSRTPKNFAELTDFEGYDPKTLDHSLMDGLTVDQVKADMTRFWQDLKKAA